MTEPTKRERVRAETEREIRTAARSLLIRHGRDAVTLRAIARDLGITAPALYRYYDSRDALLNRLRADICTALAAELAASLDAERADDQVGQVYAVCRTFRRWALAHPQEFTLVFASPADHRPGSAPTPSGHNGTTHNGTAQNGGAGRSGTGGTDRVGAAAPATGSGWHGGALPADTARLGVETGELGTASGTASGTPAEAGSAAEVGGTSRRGPDQFGRVFLGVVGQIMATAPAGKPKQPPPAELHDDLAEFRRTLLASLAESGVVVAPDSVEIDGLYEILRFWVRLYGHVALEVFDRFPVALSNGGALFESMLRELLVEFGLLPAAGHSVSAR